MVTTVGVPGPLGLTTMQRLAVQAAAQELTGAQRQWQELLRELGLDPALSYRLDGSTLVPVPADGGA